MTKVFVKTKKGKEEAEYIGVFQSSYIIEPSLMIGGHKGGVLAYPIAVVKMDGKLIQVPITDIEYVKETENKKIIENLCVIGDKCVLEIDGKYFGYDKNPSYPETTYTNVDDAYVFTRQDQALSVTTWMSGKLFRLLPVKVK